MAAIRRAEAVWEGDLMNGRGELSAESSGAFKGLPVTWASRSEERSGGKTSPEELLAAAHASCFSMALSLELAKAGAKPRRLEVSAEVTFDRTQDGYRVVSSVLEVVGHVDGIDADRFAAAADAARQGCPISKALAGDVRLEVRPTLANGAALESEQHAPA
jgi:osmotically inducible protein OsmC